MKLHVGNKVESRKRSLLSAPLELEVVFDEPLQAVIPGQIVALYLEDRDGNCECLGGGKIKYSLLRQQKQ